MILYEGAVKMATNNKIIGIILIFVILSAAFPCCVFSKDSNGATIEKTDIAFAVGSLESKSPKLCLIGKFKSGIKLTLLQSGQQKTCKTQTTSNVEVYNETSGAYVTELAGSCEFPKEFSVGILKKPVWDYQHILPKKIVIADVISKTDRSIRDRGVLLKLVNRAQGVPLNTSEMKEFEKIVPQLHQFSLPEFNVIIASYDEFPDNLNYACGPRVIIINDRIYPLTGWCSYRTFDVFRLNGQYYVKSGSCCCECGITIMELFRITPNGLVKVYSNGDLSD
jgi:hypothetical protein